MTRALPFLLLAFASGASADDGVRAKVLDHLSAYDDATTAAEWQAMGASAGDELFAIARDTSALPSRRQGATQALGWFPSEAHHVFLTALVVDETADGGMRRGACHALVNGWGDAAVSDVTRALASADEQLRNQASRALGRLGTPVATAALEARLPSEPSEMVRAAIRGSLGSKE